MYRKDYFLKLIQQFYKILEKLLDLKSQGNEQEALLLIEQTYKELLHTEKEKLNKDTSLNSLDTIQHIYELKDDQMEIWARLLLEEGDIVSTNSKQLYQISFTILNYLNEKQKLYSFEREELIAVIKGRLDS